MTCPYSDAAPDVVYVHQPLGDVLVDMTLGGGITDYHTKLLVFEDECVGIPCTATKTPVRPRASRMARTFSSWWMCN
jgi:hypothetical protein